MRARVNGVEIFFDVHGRSLKPEGGKLVEKPVMIALHGGPGFDHSQYGPWLEPLTDDVQIIYLDHRGNGRSSRPPIEQCTPEAMADDCEALRDMLGLDRVFIFGSSYGGMVALTYATRYPDHMAGLIASVTSPSGAFIDEAWRNARERATPEQMAVVEPMLTGTFESDEQMGAAFRVVRPLYYHRFDPALEATSSWSIANAEMLNWFFSTGVKRYDVREALPRITAPTLILTGRHDWICPPGQSAILLDRIPNARQVMFESSGHQLMKEENDKFLRVLREFILTGDVTEQGTIRQADTP